MRSDRLSVFPAFHKVAGRIVLVVGEGAEAAAKVRLLGETEAEIRLVAAAPGPELAMLLGQTGLEHRARVFRSEDLKGAVLVFAASGERERDSEVIAAARALRIPANAVDIPELCDFYTPAIVNRAPVVVAVSSAGAGPVLAQKLRARIEATLPGQLGALASLGESFRGAAEQVLPKGQPRRRFWSAFFEGSIADAVFAGRSDEARRLASKLLRQAERDDQGFVWLVGAGPGAADLLTLRAHRILQGADVIVHDRSLPDAVVSMGRRDAARIAVGNANGPRPASQEEIDAILVAEAKAGRRVVRLRLGDLLLPGHAVDETVALRSAGIPFEIVPGVASPLAVIPELAAPFTPARNAAKREREGAASHAEPRAPIRIRAA